MKKSLLIQLFLFSILCPVKSQNDSGLLQSERIYLHTDRNIYVAGEYLFYKMYLQDDTDQKSKYAYLILRNENNSVVTQVRLEINKRVSYGSVLISDTLSSGLYQLVCYTNLMRNAEETFFRKEIAIVNRFDENPELFTDPVMKSEIDSSLNESYRYLDTSGSILIHPGKQVYSPGEKISFSFELKKSHGDEVPDVSISVSGFLPGLPAEQSISSYFGTKAEVIHVDQSDISQYGYIPEFHGSVLQGKVISSQQSENTSGLLTNIKPKVQIRNTLLLSTSDSIANLQYTTTDSLGSFCFFLNPYYEGKELFIRIKEKTNATIELDEKTNLKKPFNRTREYNIGGLKDYLVRSGKIVQIQRFYNRKVEIDTQKAFFPAYTIPRVYSKSYLSILPSDYVELPDFIEISREILPSFKVRKNHDKYVSDYSNLLYQTTTNEEPTIFLDGVPIDDVNQIIKLGSNEIRKIESVPAVRYYGEMSFRGILSVYSKNNALRNILFKTPAIIYQSQLSQCITMPEQFKPENIPEHNPDFRQLLFWEPAFTFSGNKSQSIECFASDLKGKYRINIQGIMPDGTPVSGSAEITIK